MVHRLGGRLLSVALLVALGTGPAGCTMGCPTALASGVLTEREGGLALADETGAVHVVVWPDGYGIGTEGDRLVLTNRFGFVMAREGDRIDLGGGVGTDDVFHGCGDVVVVGRRLP